MWRARKWCGRNGWEGSGGVWGFGMVKGVGGVKGGKRGGCDEEGG